jgi:integrase
MSKTVRKYFRHDAKAFREYLERERLAYSDSIAQAFLVAARPTLSRMAYLSLRRSLALVDEAARQGVVRKRLFDYGDQRGKYHVPECFRGILDEYLARRSKEGRQRSTLQMDTIACTRFLLFLESRGIDDVTRITPETVKVYHVQARHRTHEGKNAYTCRIRNFVRFLSERGLVPETLELAFTTENAPRVSIVRTLSDTQLAAIRSHRAFGSTPSELRSAAMAALALRMGLRSIDICRLRLSDISWDTATLSIVQQKTGSPLTLPIPVEVGNALARYILKGRPKCDTPNVFVTLKRPYTVPTETSCYQASLAILGKKVSASDIRGLHLARRTFASGLLAADNPASMISRLLGHSERSSVDEYLSTDSRRMRQCAIGLAGIEPAGALL